ncbi:unnamed protein product [Mycetohabitans rhizoxinica HKI 454]|uniref:Uncharacterized protein n=1 Tax=Mycetohabitans rhizoxinica (strain DSM 19002 / CIP 109453 / HKI 454) TaxID=882378 RepID=E5AR83_MYCRK|nr:unnamed protein product [Mycetohabitans rhizoxinica HKI 454]
MRVREFHQANICACKPFQHFEHAQQQSNALDLEKYFELFGAGKICFSLDVRKYRLHETFG